MASPSAAAIYAPRWMKPPRSGGPCPGRRPNPPDGEWCVSLDWQNVYNGARRAFHAPEDPYVGQVDPVLLGMWLAGLNPDQWLTQVRI